MNGHVTNPGAIRTENHRKRLKKWWQSKEWKEYVKVHTEGKHCKECGCRTGQVKGERKPAVLTINHLYRDLYNDFEEYLKFAEDKTEVTCTTCNWMFEKGMDVCPVCFSETVAKYKKWNQPMCSACYNKFHPEIRVERERKRAVKKALLKKLRDEEKAKAKKWKNEHPKDGVLSDKNWT